MVEIYKETVDKDTRIEELETAARKVVDAVVSSNPRDWEEALNELCRILEKGGG